MTEEKANRIVFWFLVLVIWLCAFCIGWLLATRAVPESPAAPQCYRSSCAV